MPAHFKPRIEKVILLVGIVGIALDFFQFQIVAALFADLRNGDDAKLKAPGFGVVLQNLFAEAQHVKVKDMRMTATLAAAFRKEVREPQREIATIHKHVVRTDGIIRYNQAALNDIDKVRLRIDFQYVEKPVDL